MLKIPWIWKIWSEKLVDGHQTVPYQPGALFRGVNCLVVFPTHFNPNNSHITSNFTSIHVYPTLTFSSYKKIYVTL